MPGLLQWYPPNNSTHLFFFPSFFSINRDIPLYRQVLVRPLVRARLVARYLQSARQIRPDDWDVVRETRDRLEELL